MRGVFVRGFMAIQLQNMVAKAWQLLDIFHSFEVPSN
jgi:hypothetical protein